MSNDYLSMRSKLLALALGLAAACTKPNPASCLDDFCSDPALPFCDVDGTIGGTPDTCIAVQCTAGEFEACRGDDALTCNANGSDFDVTTCEFGCGETGCLPCDTAECQPVEKHVVPKYLPSVCDDLVTTELAITADTTLDTSTIAMCTSIVQQSDGPEICVLRHKSIRLGAAHTLTVTGARALALVADRELDVQGTLDASANAVTNGPGGGTIKSGGGGNNVAGGGAGSKTAGGAGGDATTNGGALNAGVAQMSPATLVNLFGGPQSNRSTGGAAPGGSGGAVTLICCRCNLLMSGTIDVNGGGGRGGSKNLVGANIVFGSPGGGGAGGNVILQGMQVTVTGQLFSNGGSGGTGDSNDNTADDGRDGLRATTCVTGTPALNGAGLGGSGGCSNSGPASGAAGPNNRAGAGGGSVGFLLTYTPQGVAPTLSPTAVSPAFEPNGVIPTN